MSERIQGSEAVGSVSSSGSLIRSIQLSCVQVFIPYRNSKLTRILQVWLNFQLSLEFLWGLSLVSRLSETVDEESLGGNALTTMMVACSVSRALVAQLVTPDFCFHCLHQTWWYGISRLPCPLRRQTQMRVCQLWIMQSRGSKFQSGKFLIRHRSAFVICDCCEMSESFDVRRAKTIKVWNWKLCRIDGTWWKDWLRASNESSSKTSLLSVARRMGMSLEGSVQSCLRS